MTGPSPLSEDLRELFASFLSHRVEFLVVAAHALAFHGHPRFTEDLHLFIHPSEQNTRRVCDALRELGFPVSEKTEAQLVQNPSAMMVLGRSPSQVDILNFLDGVDFDEAYGRSVQAVM